MVTGKKLVHVTLEVFRAHFVINAVVTSFEQRSETFNAVWVWLSVDILADRMVTALACVTMFVKPLITPVAIGVYHRPLSDIFKNNPVKRLRVRAFNLEGFNLSASAVFDSDNRNIAPLRVRH